MSSSSDESEPSAWADEYDDDEDGGGAGDFMELDAIVKQFNFRKAKDEDEYKLKECLDCNSRRMISRANVETVKRDVAAIQETICHKGFPIKNTPACEMACAVVDQLSKITKSKLTVDENQAIMFEFLLACIDTGPSSCHAAEIIQIIVDMKGMKKYLNKLQGPQLSRLFGTMKSVEFTREQPTRDLDDQSTDWGDCMLHILVETVIVDPKAKKKLADPAVHAEVVDLNTGFLRLMGELPKAFAPDIKRTLRGIQNGFKDDGDLLEVVKKGKDRKEKRTIRSKEIVERQFKGLQKVVLSEKFGRFKEQRERTVEEIEATLRAIRETPDILDYWDGVIGFMKDLALSEKCAKYPEVIKPYKYFFGNLDEKRFKKNPELVTKWMPIYSEMLQKKPPSNCLEDWGFRTASRMAEYWSPQKESAVAWLTIVKGLLQYTDPDAGRAAYYILNDDKFKVIWNWKHNEKHAREIVELVGKMDFPTENSVKKKEKKAKDSDSDDSDDSSEEEEVKLSDEIWTMFVDCINTLQKQFQIHKLEDKLGPTVTELIIKTMEKRSPFLIRFADNIKDKLSLEKCPSVVPQLMQRLAVLLTDRDYPWESWKSLLVARRLMDKSIEVYSEGKDIPAAVNKAFLKVFKFTMETEDLPFQAGVRLEPTIFCEIASRILHDFIQKHIESDSYQVCAVLIPGVIKQRSHEIDNIREMALRIMHDVSSYRPVMLCPHLNVFIDWYKESTDKDMLDITDNVYKVSKGVKKEDFRNLLQTLLGDSKNEKEKQSGLILKMAMKQPQFFVQKDIDAMIAKYVPNEESQYNVLAAFSKMMVKQTDLFGENMIKHVLKNPKVPTEYSVDLIGLTLADQKKGMAKIIMEEFMSMAKSCHDSMDKITAINGARSVAVMHGMDYLKPYRPYFENLQKKGSDVMLRDMAKLMLDAIDGVNVKGIYKEFKQKLEILDDLVEQVEETKEEVAEVKQTVKKQDKEIKTVKKDVKTVKKDVKVVKEDLEETKIKVEEVDNKTMTNAPKWSRDLTKLMNPKKDHDWRLLAKRLGYSPQDIKGWATQHDPCMGLLSEWYATHKTIEATNAILNILQEMNRMDGAAIVENAMKAVEGVVEEEVDYATPPPIFLSYQWGHQEEVKLLRNHMQMAGYECWMDIGQMGGGDKLFEKIDNGIRGAKVIICCVSEKYAKSPNCNREVNLSVNLGKPMIPLLMEKMAWPPKGSMGPIFSEYLFVRFFQRGGEETEDQRYWPVPKFQELLMQLNMYKAMPDESIMSGEYKDWWVPVAEEIVITKKKDGGQSSQVQTAASKEEETSPDVFLSYQWGKQKQIKQLYRRLNELGYSCWMDIYQMGGGDSLYDKIDKGVRGCKVVLSCVTTKYALSANCRREVSLADSLKKPMVPLLLEKIDWPPTGPMSMVFTQLLFINFYRDETVQMTWIGDKFEELHMKIEENVATFAIDATGETPKDKTPEKEHPSKKEPPKVEQKTEPQKTEQKKETPKPKQKKEPPKVEQKKEPPKTEQKKETPKTEQKKETPKTEQKKETPKPKQKKEPPKVEQKKEPLKAEQKNAPPTKQQGKETTSKAPGKDYSKGHVQKEINRTGSRKDLPKQDSSKNGSMDASSKDEPKPVEQPPQQSSSCVLI